MPRGHGYNRVQRNRPTKEVVWIYKGVDQERVGDSRLHAAASVTLRVKSVGKIPAPRLRPIACGSGDPNQALIGTRLVYDFLDVESQEFHLFDRARLQADDRVDGPALIVEPTTTTVVRRHHKCTVDHVGSLLVTRR